MGNKRYYGMGMRTQIYMRLFLCAWFLSGSVLGGEGVFYSSDGAQSLSLRAAGAHESLAEGLTLESHRAIALCDVPELGGDIALNGGTLLLQNGVTALNGAHFVSAGYIGGRGNTLSLPLTNTVVHFPEKDTRGYGVASTVTLDGDRVLSLRGGILAGADALIACCRAPAGSGVQAQIEAISMTGATAGSRTVLCEVPVAPTVWQWAPRRELALMAFDGGSLLPSPGRRETLYTLTASVNGSGDRAFSLTPLPSYTGIVSSMAWSPTGDAFVVCEEGEQSGADCMVTLFRLERNVFTRVGAQRIAGTAGITSSTLVWSRDGLSVFCALTAAAGQVSYAAFSITPTGISAIKAKDGTGSCALPQSGGVAGLATFSEGLESCYRFGGAPVIPGSGLQWGCVQVLRLEGDTLSATPMKERASGEDCTFQSLTPHEQESLVAAAQGDRLVVYEYAGGAFYEVPFGSYVSTTHRFRAPVATSLAWLPSTATLAALTPEGSITLSTFVPLWTLDEVALEVRSDMEVGVPLKVVDEVCIEAGSKRLIFSHQLPCIVEPYSSLLFRGGWLVFRTDSLLDNRESGTITFDGSTLFVAQGSVLTLTGSSVFAGASSIRGVVAGDILLTDDTTLFLATGSQVNGTVTVAPSASVTIRGDDTSLASSSIKLVLSPDSSCTIERVQWDSFAAAVTQPSARARVTLYKSRLSHTALTSECGITVRVRESFVEIADGTLYYIADETFSGSQGDSFDAWVARSGVRLPVETLLYPVPSLITIDSYDVVSPLRPTALTPLVFGKPQGVQRQSIAVRGGGNHLYCDEGSAALISIGAGVSVTISDLFIHSFSPEQLSISDSSTLTFGNNTVIEWARLGELTKRYRIEGNVRIEGRGGRLRCAPGAGFDLAPGASLTLNDLTVEAGSQWLVPARSSTVSLSHVSIALASDWRVTAGAFFFKNQVVVSGAVVWEYASPEASAIAPNTVLEFREGLSLVINPPSTADANVRYCFLAGDSGTLSATVILNDASLTAKNGRTSLRSLSLVLAGTCVITVESSDSVKRDLWFGAPTAGTEVAVLPRPYSTVHYYGTVQIFNRKSS